MCIYGIFRSLKLILRLIEKNCSFATGRDQDGDGNWLLFLTLRQLYHPSVRKPVLGVNDIEQIGERSRSEATISIAEDSPLPAVFLLRTA